MAVASSRDDLTKTCSPDVPVLHVASLRTPLAGSYCPVRSAIIFSSLSSSCSAYTRSKQGEVARPKAAVNLRLDISVRRTTPITLLSCNADGRLADLSCQKFKYRPNLQPTRSCGFPSECVVSHSAVLPTHSDTCALFTIEG